MLQFNSLQKPQSSFCLPVLLATVSVPKAKIGEGRGAFSTEFVVEMKWGIINFIQTLFGQDLVISLSLLLSRCFGKASTSGEHSSLDIVKTSTDKHTCYALKQGGNRKRLFIQGFSELVSILNCMWQWGDIPHSFPHVQHTICQANKSHVLADG